MGGRLADHQRGVQSGNPSNGVVDDINNDSVHQILPGILPRWGRLEGVVVDIGSTLRQ